MPPATSTQDNGAERETGEKVAKPAAGDLLILAAWRALFAAIDLPRVYGSESLDVTDFLECVRCQNFRIHLPTMRGRQVDPALRRRKTPKMFLRRQRRKNDFGVRRKERKVRGVLFSVRDIDVLRLLCWCQNIKPNSLNGVSTKEERENLMTMGFIKTHERSGTLLLTNKGRAFVELLLNGVIPGLRISYHDAAIERRLRLSELVLTAYYAGVDVFTTSVGGDGERPSLLITSITRNHGHNPWGSARVGAIAHLGGIYYAAHYVCPGIGRMAVNDELSALHNHTNFGKDTRRAFLFAGPSYGCILEELKARGKKSEGKLIRYSEAYRELHYPIHLLSCDETGARQLQIMAVPDYREKLARLMLRSAYQPPPEDAPAWDALYNGHPFVIGADMELRRIDAAIRIARERNCLPIALAALDAQGSAVLLARYADPGYATVYKVTDGVLTKLFGHAPALYEPPCTQFLTKKGDVVNAPLIKALGKDRVIGVLMPNGEQSDIDMARKLVEFLDIRNFEVKIKDAVCGVLNNLPFNGYDISEQTATNLPARIRMTTLYAVSQSMNGRVANTCNLSEDWVGYATRYGDAAGDFSPLSQLTVTEVKAIGRELGLPSELVDKTPTDGLCGKTDEDNLGFTYAELDAYIRDGIEPSEEVKAKIDSMHEKNLFKLQLMPSFVYQA